MRYRHSIGICVALALSAAAPAMAQDQGAMHGPAATTAPAAPYAGMETRPVKALSAQQIADLKAGRGMGLALAAELNGYPGPAHALELADALALSQPQRAQTQALFDAMKAETIPIGERIIAEETALDRLFHDRQVTRVALDDATARIGADQGALRAAHLRYHLAMADLLSPPQIARYQELRGYAAEGGDHGGMHHHHAD